LKSVLCEEKWTGRGEAFYLSKSFAKKNKLPALREVPTQSTKREKGLFEGARRDALILNETSLGKKNIVYLKGAQQVLEDLQETRNPKKEGRKRTSLQRKIGQVCRQAHSAEERKEW